MKNMQILAGGTEQYVKPQMEIIELENDTLVCSYMDTKCDWAFDSGCGTQNPCSGVDCATDIT